MPTNATYQNVMWMITSGANLASIDQLGVLRAQEGNPGGVVTVSATAIDGSAVTVSRNFTIGAMPIASTVLCTSIYEGAIEGTTTVISATS